jgi:imidazolonepropionase-like amidohydrolase
MDGKDPTVFVGADVVVEDGVITKIVNNGDFSSNLEQKSVDSDIKSIDAAEYFLTPTFIDMHTHLDKTHTDIRAENQTQSHGMFASMILY